MIDIIKVMNKNIKNIFIFLHLWFLCLCIIECVERLRNCDDIDKSKQFTKKSRMTHGAMPKNTIGSNPMDSSWQRGWVNHLIDHRCPPMVFLYSLFCIIIVNRIEVTDMTSVK